MTSVVALWKSCDFSYPSMHPLFNKDFFVACAPIALVVSLSGIGFAQSLTNPLVDTPSQRWLPPPQAYPDQPDNQAKLLTRLRDVVLSGDRSKDSNQPRLSDDDVQSLKEAMKQFAENLPEGLSPASLDAIPPDLISKALSDPELVRQAKELTEQYSKRESPESTKNNNNRDNSLSNDSLPRKTDATKTENRFNADDDEGNSTVTRDTAPLKEKTNVNDFSSLMETLRNAKQKFEKDQNSTVTAPSTGPSLGPMDDGTDRSTSPTKLPSASSSQSPTQSPNTQSPNTPSPSTVSPRMPPSGTPQPNPPIPRGPSVRSQSSPPTSIKPSSIPPQSEKTSAQRSTTDPNSSVRQYSNSKDSLNPSGTGQGLPSNRSTQDGISGQSKGSNGVATNINPSSVPSPNQLSQSALSNRDSVRGKATEESEVNSNMDIRKELERRGFGPTLQKLVDEARRAGQSLNGSLPHPSGPNSNLPTKPSGVNANKLAPSSPSEKQSNYKSPSVANSTRTPAKPDSAVLNGAQQVGKTLNKFWNAVAIPSNGSTTSSKVGKSSAQPAVTTEWGSLPALFSWRALECLLVIGVLGAVAFFAFRQRFHLELERKRFGEDQMSPRIDEICTRDDIVSAFHALAKQRLQPAQNWWTYGYVTERFERSLPEHASPIRTLSGIYEQARYFPAEHQLTSRQFEDAKLALKQCKG